MEISWAAKSQIIRMFARFYPEKPNSLAIEFADKIIESGGKRSIAQLQGHFMMFKSDPEGAVLNIDKMWALSWLGNIWDTQQESLLEFNVLFINFYNFMVNVTFLSTILLAAFLKYLF